MVTHTTPPTCASEGVGGKPPADECVATRRKKTNRGFLSTYGTYQSYYETTLLRGRATAEIAWVGTVEGVLLILGGAASGPAYDRGGPRARALLLAAGAALVGLGVVALGSARAYHEVLLAQGVCVGAGSGLLYVPSLARVAAAFFDRPRARALAAALATSGTAVGGVVYPIALARLLPAVGFGWATRILGFITLAELVVALLIIFPFSERGRRGRRGSASPHTNSAAPPPAAPAAAMPHSLIDTTAFREPVFVAFCLALFFAWTAYWVPFFLIPTYAQFALGASESWAFYLLVITNAATIPGRILPVLVIPYMGVAGSMAFFAFASAVLLFAWTAVTTMAGFEVWIVMLGVFMTPLAVLYPAIMPHLCPRPEVLGTRMGMSSAVAAMGIILGAPLSSALTDTGKGEFWKMQVFIGSAMLLGSMFMTFVWLNIRKQESK